MTNSSKLKILVAIFFVFLIILVGMLVYVINLKSNSSEADKSSSQNATSTFAVDSSQSSSETSIQSDVKEMIDLKLYFFDADDYQKVKEIRNVTIDKKLYQDDITSAINQVLDGTDIKIDKATVNGNSIVIDLPKDISLKFNEGSAGGITRTNILVMTVLNLPEIEKLEVTVEGETGVVGDHFSFNGSFTKNVTGDYYILKK